MRLSAILTTFFCVLGSLQYTHGQTTADKVYADPDEIQLLEPMALAKAGRKSFSAAERLALCQRGRGSISLACQIDSSGRIQAITGVKLYQAAQSLSPAILNRLKESVRQSVVFHVPTVDKSPKMSRYRRPAVVIPLRVFCK